MRRPIWCIDPCKSVVTLASGGRDRWMSLLGDLTRVPFGVNDAAESTSHAISADAPGPEKLAYAQGEPAGRAKVSEREEFGQRHASADCGEMIRDVMRVAPRAEFAIDEPPVAAPDR